MQVCNSIASHNRIGLDPPPNNTNKRQQLPLTCVLPAKFFLSVASAGSKEVLFFFCRGCRVGVQSIVYATLSSFCLPWFMSLVLFFFLFLVPCQQYPLLAVGIVCPSPIESSRKKTKLYHGLTCSLSAFAYCSHGNTKTLWITFFFKKKFICDLNPMKKKGGMDARARRSNSTYSWADTFKS